VKSLVITNFLLLSCLLSAQQKFEWPTHPDGTKMGSEKFEMLEEYFKSQTELPETINIINNDQPLKSRAMGEVQVGRPNFSESELHAAVNPTDPNNIVVGVMRFAPSNASDPLSISIYVTYDLGDTWTKSIFTGNKPDRSTVGGGDPMFAFDENGDLYFSWLRVDVASSATNLIWGMYVARSEDGGLTWSNLNDPIESHLATDIFTLSDLDVAVDKQWMAADLSEDSPHQGNIYLAHVNIVLADQRYEITLRRKLAKEAEFDSTKVILSHSTQSISQFANVEVANDGTVYVTFLADEDARFHTYTSYVCISKDGGATFTDPIEIGEMYFPDFASGWLPVEGIDSGRSYPCPQLALDRSGGTYEGRLYYTFTAYGIDTLEQSTLDIYLSYSDDEGVSWTDPIIVNDDLGERHNYYSSIAVNEEGTLVLAWYDRRNDLNNQSLTEYYMAYSEDGGANFEQFPVTERRSNAESSQLSNGGFGIGEYNEVVTADEFLIPFWADGRDNDGSLTVYAYFFNTLLSNVMEKQVIISEDISLTTPIPNPASEYISFDLEVKTSSPLTIRIFDSRGQQVKQVLDEKTYLGKETFKVDTYDLASGIYLLVVDSALGSLTRQIVIE